MITILMPIYNGIEFINESVGSIISQKYQNWELLIGINGYEKNSDVYKKAKLFENDKIKVFDLYTLKDKSNTLNKLIEYATYDWVSLLDVDDKWDHLKLQKQIPFMDDYDVIGTKCRYFGNKNTVPDTPCGDL